MRATVTNRTREELPRRALEATMTTATRINEELVRRGFDALNERDREAFVETHSKGVVLHDHDEEFHGVEAVTSHEWTIYDAFPDMRYTIEDTVAEDDTVASRWTVTGAHEGEFEGIAPTGKEIEISASGTFRVEDGNITEVWLTTDRLGLLQQLGAVEPPTE